MSASFSQEKRRKVAALDLVASMCANYRITEGIPHDQKTARSLDRIEARIPEILDQTVGVHTLEIMGESRRNAYAKTRLRIRRAIDMHWPEESFDFTAYLAMVMDVVNTVYFQIPREHKKHRNQWRLLDASISSLYQKQDPDWTNPYQEKSALAGDDVIRAINNELPAQRAVCRIVKRRSHAA
ncbi:MAG: hypothetical protein WC117_01175 [Sphaerochaetaceae bacterium]